MEPQRIFNAKAWKRGWESSGGPQGGEGRTKSGVFPLVSVGGMWGKLGGMVYSPSNWSFSSSIEALLSCSGQPGTKQKTSYNLKF